MLENQQPTPVLIEDLGMLFPSETSKRKARFGLYKCHCGKEFKSQVGNVKRKNVYSCGCYQKKVRTKHGLCKHPLFNIWNGMVQRTSNPKNPKFLHYGNRGIKACERWLDVNNFIEDMYQSYQKGLTIDRKDNNGNYEMYNCRWATKATQQRNTRLIHAHNTSGYRGVSFYKNRNTWASSIHANGKNNHLGYFNTPLEAAKAYDSYVIEHNLEHTINGVL